ncbi:MAG TPA: hypothetical protein VLG37_01225 [Candidatus Saccharimonadales bacterium]|nr:hypothetical protein [Candidatus Saccharimonadales bacterium]
MRARQRLTGRSVIGKFPIEQLDERLAKPITQPSPWLILVRESRMYPGPRRYGAEMTGIISLTW